jgi:hypothetical protein
MVLPGLQALFGFQLIAVFSSAFRDLAESTACRHLDSLRGYGRVVDLAMP